jgi:hypothetical protein
MPKTLMPFRLAGTLTAIVLVMGRRLAAQAAPAASPMGRLESAYLDLRDLRDQLGVTRSQGARVSPRGIPVDSLVARSDRARAAATALLAQVPFRGLSPGDSAALVSLRREIASMGPAAQSNPEAAARPVDCQPASTEALASAGLDSLTRHTFECYGAAARRILFEGDTLDRLSILGLLGRTDDPARRQRLFLALEPVWRSVNGDDHDTSPFRSMARGRVRRWAGATPMAARSRSLGVSPEVLEKWLVSVLEAWRAGMPDTLLEPWDFYYLTGAASRELSARVPLDSLTAVTGRYYGSLGADLTRLRVHFDLVPRPGKYPISFTDFGGRNPVEPWIFTSYRIGGIDNLGELLHETGHAVHIAAIRTRPAYLDWPDSDTFTEAIADIAYLEMFEPRWQRKFLGATAPLDASLRAKYSGIVMDVAWSLFEIRAYRSPETSPNQIWTEITSRYLRIRPHPEWSWWAMRGQLVDSPGYMLNYAFGAILIADIRARLISVRGRFTTGDAGWYPWVSARLYRFGHERPARKVVEDFLGRPVGVSAILADIARIRGAH